MGEQKIRAKREIILYTLAQGTFWMSYGIIVSFAAVYLQYKAFSNTQIGIGTALASILSILVQSVIAGIIDRSKKITVRHVVIGHTLVGLIFAAFLFIQGLSLPVVMVIYIVLIMLELNLPGFLNYMAMEYVNKGIDLKFGLARGIGSWTFAVMMLLLGYAIVWFQPVVMIPAFLMTYALLMACFLMMDRRIFTSVKGIKHKEQKQGNILQFLWSEKRFLILCIGIIIMFIGYRVFTTYQMNILKFVGGNEADLGTALCIAALVEMPAMAAFEYIVRKVQVGTLLRISSGFFVVKMFATYCATSVGMIYSTQILQCGAFALFTPAIVYYVNKHINVENRAMGQSAVNIGMMGASGVIGNYLGGILLDHCGIKTTMLICTILTVIGAAIVSGASITCKKDRDIIK